MSYFSARAQRTIEETYLSLENKYNFNLPILEITLKIPAKAGFNVDMDDEIKHCLNIETKDVYYYFDINALENKVVEVRFSLPETEEPALHMGMMLLPEGVGFGTISQSYIDAGTYLSPLSELQSKIGKFRGFTILEDNKPTNIYLIRHNGICYFFQYDSENEEFANEIIRSVNEKEFGSKDLKVYSDYLENDDEDDDDFQELPEFTGNISQPTIFTIPELGIGLSIPQGYSYLCRAREITDKSEVEKELLLNKLDFKKQSITSSHFNSNKGLFFMYILWDTIDVEERIAADIERQVKLKSFQLNIDDITFEAVAVGNNENPTINAYAQLKDYGISFSFLNVSKDNIGEVEYLINNIKFSDEQKSGIQKGNKKQSIFQILKARIFTQKDKPITNILNIKDKEVRTLRELTFKKSFNDDRNLVEYNFIYLGVSCKLPPLNEFIIPENCLEAISEKEKQIVAKLTDTPSLSVSDNFANSFSVTISPYGQHIELNVVLDDMIKQWESHKHVEIIQKGQGLVNGRQWGLVYIKQGDIYISMFISFYKALYIIFMGNSQKKNIQEYVDLLYTFRFGES